MRVVLRMFLAAIAVLASAAVLAACSGGGGGSSEPQGPPPAAFASTQDTDLAVGNRFADIAVLGRFALVPVSEAETGADLNNDGDLLDHVAHLLDIAANTSTNLQLAVRGKPVASDQQFAFLVGESDQQFDLSGDGDRADAVWHLLDPATPLSPSNPFNTSLSTPLNGRPAMGAVGGMVLIVAESAMGVDLSGDSDLLDDVVFAVEHLGQAISPLAIPPHAPGTPIIAHDNHILLCGSEAALGMDITGDTDANDVVLATLAFESPGAPTVRIIGSGVPRAVHPRIFAFSGNSVAYLVSEADSGADLNADGDSGDFVLALTDLVTGGEFLPVATSVSFSPLAASELTGLATSGTRLLFGIDENTQGRDLNIDQDRADSILAWIDTENAPSVVHVVGLALGSQKPLIDGTIGVITVNEAGSALVVGVDYNADGDISDQVAFRIDVTSTPAILRNLGRAVEQLSLTGTDAILMVSEAAQSGVDLTGDTDTNDLVPTYVDLGRVSPGFKSLGFAAHAHVTTRPDVGRLLIALSIPEQPLTSRADLNGDGDSLDNGQIWVEIDTVSNPPRTVVPTPYLIGIGAPGPSAPIVVDQKTLLFATNETMLDRDLNGDGDRDDTLLRIARRASEE